MYLDVKTSCADIAQSLLPLIQRWHGRKNYQEELNHIQVKILRCKAEKSPLSYNKGPQTVRLKNKKQNHFQETIQRVRMENDLFGSQYFRPFLFFLT